MRNFRETKDANFFRERDLCEFSRKKRQTFPNLTEKFRQLVNKTSVQKKYFIQH